MRLAAVKTYRCPRCHGVLSAAGESGESGDSGANDDGTTAVVAGELVCAACPSRYPLKDGIVRFVPSDNYARNFGFQWNRFQATQLDSKTGLSLSARRFWAESRWPRDLSGQLVLEAGSGAGRFTEILAATNARLFSFDYSEAVDANQRSNGHAPNAEFAQADIFAMPFLDDTFDRVVCLGVLQHTPSARAALASLVRVLKPGGHLVADHYALNSLTAFRGKYWLRPFTRGRKPETLFPWVRRYFDFWYGVLGTASPLLGTATTHIAEVVGICDYRKEIPEASADLVREMSLLDTFDMLLPTYDRPRHRATLRTWLEELGLTDIDVTPGYNGVEMRARKRG